VTLLKISEDTPHIALHNRYYDSPRYSRLPIVKDGSGNRSQPTRKTASSVVFPRRICGNFPLNFFGALIPLRAFAIEESSFFDVILWNSLTHRIDIWEHAL
jgi:hypothetical protein